MQSIKVLQNTLKQRADDKCYLFKGQDLRSVFENLSDSSFNTLLSRAVKSGHLHRVCRGLYLCKDKMPNDGLFLFHVAAYLRSDEFNYISLETVLSDAGIISQVPMQWISLMSSGCSNIISCGDFGTIEFIHTKQRPNDLVNEIHYDQSCRLWRASPLLALRDMKTTRRNCDIIDWDSANELI